MLPDGSPTAELACLVPRMACLNCCCLLPPAQSPTLLIQCSAAALCLLRESRLLQQPCRLSTVAGSTSQPVQVSSLCQQQDSEPAHETANGCMTSIQAQHVPQSLLGLFSSRASTPASHLLAARLHHAAVLDSAGSDEDAASTAGSSSSSSQHRPHTSGPWQHKQPQQQQQHQGNC